MKRYRNYFTQRDEILETPFNDFNYRRTIYPIWLTLSGVTESKSRIQLKKGVNLYDTNQWPLVPGLRYETPMIEGTSLAAFYEPNYKRLAIRSMPDRPDDELKVGINGLQHMSKYLKSRN